MAKFNPDIETKASSNYISYSQGQTPNKALGVLFGSLADAVEGGLKEKAGRDQNNLEQAIYEGVESAATTGEPSEQPSLYDTPTRPNPKVEPGLSAPAMPHPDVGEFGNDVRRLGVAKEQGVITTAQYRLKLADLSRKIKGQFPQYEREIDGLISQYSNQSTANQMRELRESEENSKNASLDAKEKRRIALLKEADPIVQGYYKAVTGKQWDPNEFDEAAFNYAIAQREFEDKNLERGKNKLALKSAERTDKKEEAKRVASTQIALERDRWLYAAGSYGSLQEQLKAAGADGKYDPEEIKAIGAIFRQLKTEASFRVDAILTGRDANGISYADYITEKSDRDDLTSLFMQPIQIIEEAMTNNQTGVLNAIQNDATARLKYKENELLQKGPTPAERLQPSFDKYGKERVNDILYRMATNGRMTEEEKALGVVFTLALAGGEDVNHLIKTGMKNGDIKNANVIIPAIQANIELLTNPETSKETAVKAAMDMLDAKRGIDAEGFTPEAAQTIFDVVFNPAVIEKLKGTPAAERMYVWGLYSAKRILEPLANTMASSSGLFDPNYIAFDNEKKRFVWTGPTPDSGTFGWGLQDWNNPFNSHRYTMNSVNKLNTYLDKMQPIVDVVEGKDAGASMDLILGSLFYGQDFKNLDKQDSLFNVLKDKFTSGMKNAIEEGSKAVNQERVKKDRGGTDAPDPDAHPTGEESSLKDKSLIKYSRGDVQSADDFLASVSSKPREAIEGLDDNFSMSLAALIQEAPPEIKKGLGIFSAKRSTKRQKQLWVNALNKYGSAAAARPWVAPPGRSRHEKGMAADLSWNGGSLRDAPAWVVAWVHKNAGKHKLHFPLDNENWHVEPAGSRKKKKAVDSN